MASFYWYERDPDLFELEKIAMASFFPSFRLEKLGDGKLSWIGTLNPSGVSGGIWTVMALYENNHPNNSTYGGSIKIYPIRPNLNELRVAVEKLPHVLSDSSGELYICTSSAKDFNVGEKSTSAASALSWASKWIFFVEGWLEGTFNEEILFSHNL